MQTTKIIDAIKDDVKNIFAFTDKAHDFSHTIRVYENSCDILKYIKANEFIVKVSALLHDVDDHKLNLGLECNAERILGKYEFSNENIEQILNIISEISFSKGKKITTIEAKIVQDADRLDAIGAIGIARVFTYSGKHDIPIYSSNEVCAIDHFYEKLLKLADLMNFNETKLLARKKTDFMLEFLNQIQIELNIH